MSITVPRKKILKWNLNHQQIKRKPKDNKNLPATMLASKLQVLLGPVLTVSRVLGVFPLSKELLISRAYFGVSVILDILLTLALGFIGRFAIFTAIDNNDNYRIIMYFRMCFLALIPASNTIKLIIFKSEMQNILLTLQSNELVLRRANVRITYGKKFISRTVVARLAFIIIQEVFAFLVDNNYKQGILLRNVYFVLGIIMVQLIQIQLYTFLHLLESQLSFLLELTNRKKPLKEIDILIVLQVQNRLLATGSDLNNIYSHQTLFIIIYGYLSFITAAYHIAINIRDYMNTGYIDITESLEKTTWVIYSILDICTLSAKCLSTTTMASNVDKALYRLLVTSRQRELMQCKKLRLHFVVGRKIEFTACDLFNIDYTLVHSVLASTLTLLVIMIQMS